MKWLLTIFIFAASITDIFTPLQASDLVLRNNLQTAQVGDYIVISAGKTETLLFIYAKQYPILTIEEIATPENKGPQNGNWKQWVNEGAPGNTSWVRYDIDLQTGKMVRYYSFTKRNWFNIPDADNFLSKLLNLKFTQIPESARKRVGPKPSSGKESRPLWQPRMIVDGQPINGVLFDAWRTRWVTDGSELSGKMIEVYLPKDTERYPAYFPYWLQINGAIGKAKVRIINSGNKLQSSKPMLQ